MSTSRPQGFWIRAGVSVKDTGFTFVNFFFYCFQMMIIIISLLGQGDLDILQTAKYLLAEGSRV